MTVNALESKDGFSKSSSLLSGLRVLIACEFSGTVRDAFRRYGADAMSCDLLPTEAEGPHYHGDVEDVIQPGRWDLMIAHPSCTYLTNSGVRWLHTDQSRWAKLDDAARFFLLMLNAPIPHVAVENPIMHKYARERIGGLRQTQLVQPWMFGHTEKKGTCFWLKNLPALVPTTNLKAQTNALPKTVQQRLHYMPPGPDRWKERSKTYPGIADAMAKQWGLFCMADKAP